MLALTDPKVLQLAQAIAKAEGFYVPNSLPARINNPCDLELGDRGYGTQAGKTVFEDIADGWAAGCHEAWLMLTGTSHIYNATRTFFRIGTVYTGGDNSLAWAVIVSGELGLSESNTLQDFLNE